MNQKQAERLQQMAKNPEVVQATMTKVLESELPQDACNLFRADIRRFSKVAKCVLKNDVERTDFSVIIENKVLGRVEGKMINPQTKKRNEAVKTQKTYE